MKENLIGDSDRQLNPIVYENKKPKNARIVEWMHSKNVDIDNMLSLSYSVPAQVTWRNEFINNHKKKLLVKFSNMRVQGQGLKLLARLENWVNRNFEMLFDQKNLRDKFVEITLAVRRKKPKGMPEEEYQRIVFRNSLLKYIAEKVIPKRKKLR